MAAHMMAYRSVPENNESRKPKRRYGNYCVVAKCTGKHSDGISVHTFPKDSSLRRQWINFVRVCRADFIAPSQYSVVCERHFAPECYPVTYTLKKQEGFEVPQKRLIPGSVPTLQEHAFSRSEKWQFDPKTYNACGTVLSQSVTMTGTISTITNTTGSQHRPVVNLYQLPGVTKPRGAYVKREHQRALNEIFSSHPISTHTSVSTDTLNSSENTSKCMEANTWLTKTEGNDNINLQPSCEPTENKYPYPVKNKAPVKRASNNDTGSPKIFLKTIKMEDNPDIGLIGMTSSTTCEQHLDASCLYKVVALDELPYAIALPAVSSARCLGPVSLHKKKNHSGMRGCHQTWTATSDQHSADVHCDVEVKQEVSTDEEESPAISTQLEVCDLEEEAVTERLSPHHIPHQGTVTTKETCSHEIALLTHKHEPQRTRTLENVKSSYSRCLKTESQNENINLINPAFIKKEPKDFETLWNAETMTQVGNHSSESKTGTEITMAGSEKSSSVNKLTPFIKKEPEDFNSSWSMVQTDNDGFENKMETKVYPTGIYRNVHFAHLKRGDRQ